MNDVDPQAWLADVLSRIWAALCVCLLLAFLRFVSLVDLSLQQIARLLQLNLFLKRDLLELLTLNPPPDPAPSRQGVLSL